MDIHPIIVQNVSTLTAFIYGLLAFFTPCMFPLIPILLPISYSRGFRGVVGFSFGFVATYTALGIIPLRIQSPILKYVVSVVLIIMGVLYISEKSLKSGKILKFILEKETVLPSTILGAGIGWIWMACATPILGSIISLISMSQSYKEGIFLMMIYSLGILIPFLGFGKLLSGFLERLSEKRRKMIRVLGGMLVILSALWIMKAL